MKLPEDPVEFAVTIPKPVPAPDSQPGQSPWPVDGPAARPPITPAAELARETALRQLGATSVEADGPLRVIMTYDNNTAAVNADALLKDEIAGVQLVIKNVSMTPDAPTVSPQGIADVLKGVDGLEVYVGTPRGGSPAPVFASSADPALAKTLQGYVNRMPALGIELAVFLKPDATLPASRAYSQIRT